MKSLEKPITDEDQGKSGASAEDRLGFQRLLAEVSLNLLLRYLTTPVVIRIMARDDTCRRPLIDPLEERCGNAGRKTDSRPVRDHATDLELDARADEIGRASCR